MTTSSLTSGCIDGDIFARRSNPLPNAGWAIVPRNSTAAFSVRNFGVRAVHGVVPVTDATVVLSGHVTLPPATATAVQSADLGVSAVRMTLDLAGIDTANTRRDKDLRSRHLLDTEHHPQLIFDCADVRAVPGGWRLDGTLTAHGRTIPVTVDAVLVSGPVREHITVLATTAFDRRQLGIRVPRLMIGRDVAVQVSAQFRRIPPGPDGSPGT